MFSDSSYLVFLSHISLQGSPHSPKVTKNTTKINRSLLAIFIMGKLENSPIKTKKCKVFMIFPMPLPSQGGKSIIHHPRNPPQCPKASKNATEMTRFCSDIFFCREQFKTVKR